jgi:hypothetical protein
MGACGRVLAASLAVIAVACGASTPYRDEPRPGLEVLTPRVGIGGQGAVIVRTARAASVTVELDGEALGAAWIEPGCAAAVSINAPGLLDLGEEAVATVAAQSAGGPREEAEVTIVGLGLAMVGSSEGFGPDRIAALGERALMSSGHRVVLEERRHAGGDLVALERSVTALVASGDGTSAIAALEGDEVVVLETENHRIEMVDRFSLPPYDGTGSPIGRVNAFAVAGQLLGVATDRGMSLMDLSVVDESGVHCRARSFMTATLAASPAGEEMAAVAVSPEGRLWVAADTCNVNEGYDDDPGGCEPALPARGTLVIEPPEGVDALWGVVAMARSGDRLWINRDRDELLAVPVDVAIDENRRIPDEVVRRVDGTGFAMEDIGALAPRGDGRVWAAMSSQACSLDGLALLDDEGLDLWVDRSFLASGEVEIRAVDRSEDGTVWVATGSVWGSFLEP